MNAWWVYGPVHSPGEKISWRKTVWPGRFISLDENRSASPGKQQYLLYRQLFVSQEIEAQILCASDVQLEIRVNGAAVGALDASPQYSQPRHDELMLNQKRAFT